MWRRILYFHLPMINIHLINIYFRIMHNYSLLSLFVSKCVPSLSVGARSWNMDHSLLWRISWSTLYSYENTNIKSNHIIEFTYEIDVLKSANYWEQYMLMSYVTSLLLVWEFCHQNYLQPWANFILLLSYFLWWFRKWTNLKMTLINNLPPTNSWIFRWII